MATVCWLDHDFDVFHSIDGAWNSVPGVYLFAGINSAGNLYPVYVGETESLAERLPNHERWQEAVREGATQIHAKVVRPEQARLDLQKALIRAYSPRLNVKHRQ